MGELLLRELSLALHSRWRSESVGITLTGVDVSADLRGARVYYSAIGGRAGMAAAGRFLAKNKRELKTLMMQKITLKYTPDIEFVYDHSFERGARVMDIIEELERGESRPDSHAEKPEDSSDKEDAPEKKPAKKSKKGGAYKRLKNPDPNDNFDD